MKTKAKLKQGTVFGREAEKGITMVALIITIIVLIILAAVTIKSFYDSKFMNTAMNGTINYAKTQGDEVEMMQNISDKLDETVNKIGNLNIGGVTGGGNTPEVTLIPLPAGWNGDKVEPVKTDDGVIVPVPKGFTPSDKPEERKEETGFVIKQDGINNEFVWVPVPKDGTFGTLYEFSGETANPNTNTNCREPDILTDADASTKNGRGIEQLTNVVGITGATSTMIWWCQWDATMKWFLRSTDSKVRGYVTNSTGMGNYNSSGIIPAGTNPAYKVNNIYDMAGNVRDWTLEANYASYRVGRRGLLQR